MTVRAPDHYIFQALYDSEINFAVSSFWDGGWRVKLGDDMNGFKAERSCDDWHEVAPALRDMAFEHYPASEFTKAWQPVVVPGGAGEE